jgi:hypothetical protein
MSGFNASVFLALFCAAGLGGEGAVAVAESAPRPLVRVLVPTEPGLFELTVLTQAELAAAALEVEHRALPAGEASAWIEEARRDRALAVVVLEGAMRPRARVWLLGTGASPGPHLLEGEPDVDARGAEGAAVRVRSTLALRVAELVREHRQFVAAAARVKAAPAKAAPPAPVVTTVAPVAAEPSHAPVLRIEVAAAAGRSLHPTAPTVGLDFGLARHAPHGVTLRLGLGSRTAPTALAGPGGTVRCYETRLAGGVSIEGPTLPAGFVPELGGELGLVHTLLVGSGGPGFQGGRVGAFAFAAAGEGALFLPLGAKLGGFVALRVAQVFPRPAVYIDDVEVSRRGPSWEGRVGVRYFP